MTDSVLPHLADALALAQLERPGWAAQQARLDRSGVPQNSGNDADGKDKNEAGEKRLGQAEVDRIVEERLARERTKYADYADLKAKAEKFDAAEAANQTELERVTAELTTANETLAAEKAAHTETQSALRDLRTDVTIRAALPKEIVDADAALALLPRDQVTVGDDGQVTGHEDAVKALLKAKPYLVGESTTTAATGPTDGGAQGAGAPNPADVSPGLGRLSAAYGATTASST